MLRCVALRPAPGCFKSAMLVRSHGLAGEGFGPTRLLFALFKLYIFPYVQEKSEQDADWNGYYRA